MKKFDRNKEMELYKTEEEQLEAINENPYNIVYIKNPSEEMKLESVKQDGCSIAFIKNPSEKVQLEAVQQDGSAIEFIKNPSEKIKLKAVEVDGCAISYIKNPSEEIIKIAILNGANKNDLMRIRGIDWNKISDELWLQIQLM